MSNRRCRSTIFLAVVSVPAVVPLRAEPPQTGFAPGSGNGRWESGNKAGTLPGGAADDWLLGEAGKFTATDEILGMKDNITAVPLADLDGDHGQDAVALLGAAPTEVWFQNSFTRRSEPS